MCFRGRFREKNERTKGNKKKEKSMHPSVKREKRRCQRFYIFYVYITNKVIVYFERRGISVLKNMKRRGKGKKGIHSFVSVRYEYRRKNVLREMTPRRHVFAGIRRAILAAAIVGLIILALSNQDGTTNVQQGALLDVSVKRK